jgi:hypothetical protein
MFQQHPLMGDVTIYDDSYHNQLVKEQRDDEPQKTILRPEQTSNETAVYMRCIQYALGSKPKAGKFP